MKSLFLVVLLSGCAATTTAEKCGTTADGDEYCVIFRGTL
jgi:hypothetical protein